MEVDTGAAVSVISEKLCKRRFRAVKLMLSNCVLTTYNKESLRLIGSISVKVKCNGNGRILNLLVVKVMVHLGWERPDQAAETEMVS